MNGRCAQCSSPIDPADGFMSSDGLVCEACHRMDAQRARAAENARESRVESFLSALLAGAGGVGVTTLAIVLPAGPIPDRFFGFYALGVTTTLGAAIATFRWRGTLTKKIVALTGLGLAVLATIVLIQRL